MNIKELFPVEFNELNLNRQSQSQIIFRDGEMAISCILQKNEENPELIFTEDFESENQIDLVIQLTEDGDFVETKRFKLTSDGEIITSDLDIGYLEQILSRLKK